MPVKTVIVVMGGLVCDVYSTLSKDEHEIELLDLDNSAEESETGKEEMESRISEVSGSPTYHTIF